MNRGAGDQLSKTMELNLDSEARSARFLSVAGQDFDDNLQTFVNSLELKGRTVETIRAYGRAVKHLGAWLTEERGRSPDDLWILETYDIDTLAAWQRFLLDRYEARGRATAALKIAATNALMIYLGDLPQNAEKRPPKKIAAPVVDLPEVFLLPNADMQRMQEAAAPEGNLDALARCFFWVCLDSWQRSGSIMNIRVKDIDLTKSVIHFRASSMKGKTGLKLKLLCAQTLPSIVSWLRESNPDFLKEQDGKDTYLFCAKSVTPHHGRFVTKPDLTKHFSQKWPGVLLKRVAIKAQCSKLTIRNIHVHAIRRWCITQAKLQGLTLGEIASRSGHRNFEVLESRYVRLQPRTDIMARAILKNGATTTDESSPSTLPSVSQNGVTDSELLELLRENRELRRRLEQPRG